MQRIETVTSAANPLVRDVRRAIARGGLTADGLCIAEGFHLLEEALKSRVEVPVLLVAESVAFGIEGSVGRIVRLPDNLFQSMASTETTQGVMALVKPPEWKVEDLFAAPDHLVVVLDGVQDPGNAGAIVRAAEAFGATGVMYLKGTVSPWNPKSLRASAGSSFRVPSVVGAELTFKTNVYAAMPFTGTERTAAETDLTRPCAIVIGSEGRGVSSELRLKGIAIPTIGVESLNASVAAAVLLYEARRQRTAR